MERGQLLPRGAEPVDVLHHHESGAVPDPVDVVDHRGAELVEHEELLRQVAALDESREPGGGPVHLGGADVADDVSGDRAVPHPPLRVQGQADPRVLQRPAPALGGLQEVGVTGLQVEQQQGAVAVRGTQVRLDRRAVEVVAVVAVVAGATVGDGDDELIDQLHRSAGAFERAGGPSQLALHPRRRRPSQYAEGSRAGRAVIGDQEPVAAEHRGPAAGQRGRRGWRGWRGGGPGGRPGRRGAWRAGRGRAGREGPVARMDDRRRRRRRGRAALGEDGHTVEQQHGERAGHGDDERLPGVLPPHSGTRR